MQPPRSSPASTRCTSSSPRLASTIAHSIPAGPAPITTRAAVGVPGAVEPLRVPAAAVLLAGGRVLGAAQVAAPDRARVARVAADALADLVVAALLDLHRQERVGDRRPGGADQVGGAASHHLGHAVGIGEPADHDDRLLRRLAGAARPLELVALLEEPRRAAVDPLPAGERADGDVPQVDHGVRPADELEPLRQLDARPLERVGGDPDRDRAVAADGLAHQLDRLEPEAGPVLEASRRRRRCGGCRPARETAVGR